MSEARLAQQLAGWLLTCFGNTEKHRTALPARWLSHVPARDHTLRTVFAPHRLEEYGIKYGYSPVLLAHPDALT